MRLLVLGATGMLGSALLRYFSGQAGYEVHGSARNAVPAASFAVVSPGTGARGTLHGGIDMRDMARIEALVQALRPGAVLNCIGLIKQLERASDPVQALRINTLLPHELARVCSAAGSKLIHFSTDCVFAGTRGHYSEQDPADADDLYGRSKRLGEVGYGGHLTLRTSFIGHERGTHHALLDWFRHAAATPGARVKGFRRAVFSGLTTLETARVLHRHILPRPALQGLYHLGGEAIDKYTLLGLVAREYGLQPALEADSTLVIDRSLDAGALRRETGYEPRGWPALVAAMHADFISQQGVAPAGEGAHPAEAQGVAP